MFQIWVPIASKKLFLTLAEDCVSERLQGVCALMSTHVGKAPLGDPWEKVQHGSDAIEGGVNNLLGWYGLFEQWSV